LKYHDFSFSLTENMLQSWFAPLEDIPVMTDPSSDSQPSPPRRDRSLAGRRQARADKAGRERRIANFLNAGVTVDEIAVREGLSVKRTRNLVRETLARHRPEPPAEFVALQLSRLREALLVSYSAMGGGNLGAVDRYVKIVREMDRYHGFAPRQMLPPPEPKRLASPAPTPLALEGPSPERLGNGAASD
jgi:DNA-binding CsgD family transcriptional regulator